MATKVQEQRVDTKKRLTINKILTIFILLCMTLCVGKHIRYVYLHVFASSIDAWRKLGYSSSFTNIIAFYSSNIKDLVTLFNIPANKVVIMNWIDLDQFDYWLSFLLRLPCYIIAFIFIRICRVHKKLIFYILSVGCLVAGLFFCFFSFYHTIELQLKQHNEALGYYDYAVWHSSGFDIDGDENRHDFTEETGIEIIQIP